MATFTPGPTDAPIDEAARRAAVERIGALERRGDKELQRITDLAASRYNTSFACVSIVTGHREVLLCRCAVPFWDTPRSQSFCAIAIQRPGEPLIVSNAAKDPRFAHFEVVHSPPYVKFYAGMPLVCRWCVATGMRSVLCALQTLLRGPRSGLTLSRWCFSRERRSARSGDHGGYDGRSTRAGRVRPWPLRRASQEWREPLVSS